MGKARDLRIKKKKKRIIHRILNTSWNICFLVVNGQSFLVIDGYLRNLSRGKKKKKKKKKKNSALYPPFFFFFFFFSTTKGDSGTKHHDTYTHPTIMTGQNKKKTRNYHNIDEPTIIQKTLRLSVATKS